MCIPSSSKILQNVVFPVPKFPEKNTFIYLKKTYFYKLTFNMYSNNRFLDLSRLQHIGCHAPNASNFPFSSYYIVRRTKKVLVSIPRSPPLIKCIIFFLFLPRAICSCSYLPKIPARHMFLHLSA